MYLGCVQLREFCVYVVGSFQVCEGYVIFYVGDDASAPSVPICPDGDEVVYFRCFVLLLEF